MNDKELFVEYQVTGFEGIQKSGPFCCTSEALEQAKDIAGYEGVYDVKLVDGDTKTKIIC